MNPLWLLPVVGILLLIIALVAVNKTTPKKNIYIPKIPVHNPWTCHACSRVVDNYTTRNHVCIACTLQAESMGIESGEFVQFTTKLRLQGDL